jgi:hypothetical protein
VRCCFELGERSIHVEKQPEYKHPQAVLAKNENARAKVLTGNIKSVSIGIIQISLHLRESASIPGHLRLINYLFKTADTGR